ncbi:GDP-mannose 4,6-dehydratase [Azospirillum picis]|uniref:GDP-mannose 4,6-dehydratase n=1 Tax=Azospirillum picis TaxID=488438 RepID=A0ABU0MSN9_9PROT|nr:GDP-mannose 4,6-dehydratase [Azospirillum picis]MBP2302752.1 GDPmannose 4,6-dehydratase [Azospirillum picis]MDQ0536503.1 GDPmannose 4,6-dehydratase [Azospirillum picis]
MTKALITGIAGQDGAYLSRSLLDNGYEVVGIVRKERLGAPLPRLQALGVAGDVRVVGMELTDLSGLSHLLGRERPDEVYNLAGQSVVRASWQAPIQATKDTAQTALTMLEALRLSWPSARFLQASSSEMFGSVEQDRRNEATRFLPCSPYAVAKLFAHLSAINYRDTLGLHASCAILFNHESPLRGTDYVLGKIADGVARIKLGKAQTLRLGNLDSRRDWGHARDYASAMHLMLQQDRPDDYVIATGRTSTVHDVCRIAFGHVGLAMEDHVVVDPVLVRPREVRCIEADASKARRELGWEPLTRLEELVVEMVEADLRRIGR